MTERERITAILGAVIDGYKKAVRDYNRGIKETAPGLAPHIAAIQQLLTEARTVTGETSDGYHTFNELYEFRKLYNAALFNEWAKQGKYNVHKSWRHHEGDKCFGGDWFIVMATLPTGQISNHYEAKDWDLFDVPYQPGADKWDGHTPQDVAKRLAALTSKGETND